MAGTTIERLLEVVRRSLKAARVELMDEDKAPAGVLRWSLPSGRAVVVHFDGAPAPQASERLQALLSSFGGVLMEGESEGAAAASEGAASLVDELSLLATAVGATEALVIDAHSPVVWGSSHGITSEEVLGPRLRLVTEESAREEGSVLSAEAQQAVRRVRALPESEELPRGAHLRYTHMDDQQGLVARSFAGIYVLVLVYPGRFDELKTERQLHSSLPRIEQLVLSLPPPGPAEGGGSAAAKRR